MTATRRTLCVLEDENGDLFLTSLSVCKESLSSVVLRDPALWDAYVVSCEEMNRARQRVLDALVTIEEYRGARKETP